MKRKAYGLFFVLLLMLCASVFSILNVSGTTEYVMAAGRQSVYQLTLVKARGAIYDCNLNPLTGGKRTRVAAVAPTIESIGALEQATGGTQRERLAAALENGKPFAMELNQKVSHNCIEQFWIPQRYEEDQLAPHVVGYVDGSGNGVSGIEYAMDDLLSQASGEITLYYRVDALGRVIAGANRQLVDTMDKTKAGVVLTIDSQIQEIVERAARKLQKGAVVVTEVPNGKVRALASVPDYSPYEVGAAASDPDSPLVNRAFSAYSPGSVFKLVTAAQQMEEKADSYSFSCTGSINAGGMIFQCIDGTAHGVLDLRGALEHSCNCYFVSAARALGGQSVLEMAYNLGFGSSQEFGRGLSTSPGLLPEPSALENTRALANFSFGQGDLTVTPMQVAGMINTIASGGKYSSLKLIEGTADQELNVTPVQSAQEKAIQVLEHSTAKRLQNYLESAASSGTGRAGAPSSCASGIKTGTAQTGIYENGEELLHFWYTGYISDGTGPKYTITVLRESTPDDYGMAAKVFQEIGEGISQLRFSPETPKE